MNSLEPPRPPWNLASKGELVIPKYASLLDNGRPKIVCEVYYEWGNPNGDNTADHWYWVYVFEDATEALAKYYREFKAQLY